MPVFDLPPKLGSILKSSKSNKKMFARSGVDKYCPTCKKVFAGPDEGKTLDFQRDTSRQLGPITINRHKTSIETCPDCLEHGHGKVGME